MIFYFSIVFVILFLLELLYFFIANKMYIIDAPNERSSHQSITIRGGGIIFPLSGLAVLFFTNTYQNLNFILGLLFISILSFIDDLISLSSRLRLIVQFFAIMIVFFPFFSTIPIYFIPLMLIISLGIINAYNFMDGINGLTALYSIMNIISLYWISENIIHLQSIFFFLAILASLLVFSFFNLRSKAKCFAGDVGSISIAFIISYFLFLLIIKTGYVYWLFFLAIYGVDTVCTIFFRILRKEPLMKPHRTHFYQYLVNQGGCRQITVSLCYALIQGFLNFVVIYAYLYGNLNLIFAFMIVVLILYISLRLRLEGSERLIRKYF